MRFLVVLIGGAFTNVIVGVLWYFVDTFLRPQKMESFWFYITIKGDRIRMALCLTLFLIIINIIGWENTPW